MTVYRVFSRGNGITDITYTNNGFVFSGNIDTKNGKISASESEIIYRGSIHFENSDYGTAYINIINYKSVRNTERKIRIIDMEMLSDHFIKINSNTISLSSFPLNTRVQIVEIPSFQDCIFDTNSVEIEEIITSNPFIISLPEEFKSKEYVIWIDNMCKKLAL